MTDPTRRNPVVDGMIDDAKKVGRALLDMLDSSGVHDFARRVQARDEGRDPDVPEADAEVVDAAADDDGPPVVVVKKPARCPLCKGHGFVLAYDPDTRASTREKCPANCDNGKPRTGGGRLAP